MRARPAFALRPLRPSGAARQRAWRAPGTSSCLAQSTTGRLAAQDVSALQDHRAAPLGFRN